MQKHLWLLSTLFLSLALFTGCSSSASSNAPEPSPPASEIAAPTPESTSPPAESTAPAPESTSPPAESTAPAPESSTSPQDSTAETEAVQAATEYKNSEYTVKDYADVLSEESIEQRNDAMRSYLTEDFYQKAINNRYTALPLMVVQKQQMSVKPENLKFTLTDGTKKDIVELKYNVDLVLLNQKGKENKRVPMEGILTMFNVDGQWLVQGDRFDNAAFNKLIN
ncbi:hypothetical protein [Paenibacillus sp. P46E]|uniref:hypothetical protein n=1 Tax=Paenibacillus sp. P46E TaxID=1349436 RepID=UPI00093FB318|nr:hypothetical protein [Paenibacillus sp. P46E]OKP99505.1 hypothetical protein A3849_04670 [Paenibacillus sp. P46E]